MADPSWVPVASTSELPVNDLAFNPNHDLSIEDLEPSDPEDGDGPPKKRKRHRQALSCAPCKKRKIKCDRKLPCEACIKRNAVNECRWEEKVAPPPPQPFALATDMDMVKRKISHIENVLTRLVTTASHGSPSAHGSLPKLQPRTSETAGLPSSTLGVIAALDKRVHHSQMPGSAKVAPSEVDSVDVDSDTEDAALVLEEIAMGRRRVYGSLKAKLDAAAMPTIPRPTLVGGGLTSCRRPPDKTRHVGLAYFDRDALMNQIWPSLPPRKICEELLDIYFEQFDWSWHTHHTPAFRAEVAEFFELLANGQQNEVDPAWVGFYLATLCVALHVRGTDTPLGTLDGQQLKDQPGVFFELSSTALRAAQWSAKPQVRVVQTVLLFGPFLTHFSGGFSSERAGHMLVWMSAGIQIARLLGLHALGLDSGRVPPDDPAWPPGDNSMKREMAKRLWHALVYIDWSNGARGGTFSIAPDQFTTPLPANVNDEDIGLQTTVVPRPVDESTDASFQRLKWQGARHARRVADRIRQGTYTYEYLLEIDANYRKSINDLCGTQILDSVEEEPTTTPPTKAAWLRGAMISTLHNRLTRLHRPFMARGFKDGRYQVSAKEGVASARAIMRTHSVLMGSPPSQFWSVYVHTLGAAVLLSMATLHDIEVQAPAEQINAYLGDMMKARDFFRAGQTTHNASVRAVAAQGSQIIGSLIDAVHRHKAAFDAGQDPKESLVDIFRRLAARLTNSNPPTAPSSPMLAPATDPTLVSDSLLQSMGLLDGAQVDGMGELDAWPMGGDSGSYMGEGMFGSDPNFIDWSGLLSGTHASGW